MFSVTYGNSWPTTAITASLDKKDIKTRIERRIGTEWRR